MSSLHLHSFLAVVSILSCDLSSSESLLSSCHSSSVTSFLLSLFLCDYSSVTFSSSLASSPFCDIPLVTLLFCFPLIVDTYIPLTLILSVLTSSTSYASVVSSLSSHQAPLYASVAPLLLLFSSCLLLYLCELFPLLLSRVVYVLTTFSSPLVFVSIHSHSPLSQLLI